MGEQDENFDPDPDTTCTVCFAEFLDPDDLQIHMDQLHPDQSRLQACHFCSLTFSSLEKYAYHLRDEHIMNLKSCRHCKKVFTAFEALRKHEIKHRTGGSKTLFSCSQCKAVFETTFSLEQHEIQDHKNEFDGVILHDVFPILSSVLNIKADIFLQSMGTNAEYICVCCEITTNDVHEYLKHLKESKCRSIVCDKCSNVYKSLRGLRRHLLAHNECFNYVRDEDKKKPCPKCGVDVEKLHLTSHMLTCNPLICRICDLRYKTVDELSLHQSTEHPLAISLKNCQFCRREFVGTVALEKHINRVHRGEFHLYKYMCVYCENMYFKHPKNLFFHFFSKHHDLEPYLCKICDKKFKLRKKFTFHIKLEHKSQGFVEFDEKYHVFFTDTKSEKPFQPTSLLANEDDKPDLGSQTETELQQTDKETDAETSTKAGKKPLKLRLKEQKKGSKKTDLSLNRDIMSVTETEGNATETDTKSGKTRTKRKRKSKMDITKKFTMTENGEEFTEVEMLEESNVSDDEPLDKVKKKLKTSRKAQVTSWNKKRIVKTEKTTLSRKKFTCKICKKYCYTYQNYHHHISLHFKNGSKRCIKCSKEFKSKVELDRHVAKKHTTSKLTETLKSLLERRKQGGGNGHLQLTPHEKFLKSIKKVRSEPFTATARITEVSKDLSVQKFIESFTPDENSKKENVEIDSLVTMKPLKNAIKRPPAIKLTKFRPQPINNNIRLSMPVRYKQSNGDPVKVSIKLINPIITNVMSYAPEEEKYEDDSYNYQDYDYEVQIDNTDKNDMVPEVAHEVMLEESEEPRSVQQLQHKIVLPKVPQGYNQIRIAHLQPQAPYYKIVKVGDVIKDERKDSKTEGADETIEEVKLPGGAKLVNVNPLAHLLGDTPIEEVIGEPKKKYYKSKTSNFEKAIAKALLELDKPSKTVSKPKKPPTAKKSKKSVEVEQ